ncbi:hypothetical protein ACVQ8P_08045 [Dellaglioa sp. BT-FLS60]
MTMTYKQFRELPELEGCKLEYDILYKTWYLWKSHEKLATFIEGGLFKNDYNAMRKLDDKKRVAITVALFELMMTPIDQREEPKRYYIHRVPEMGEQGYLNVRRRVAVKPICIGDKNMLTGNWQTSFTMEEVRQLEVKYDEDYSGMLEEAEED